MQKSNGITHHFVCTDRCNAAREVMPAETELRMFQLLFAETFSACGVDAIQRRQCNLNS